MSRKKATPAPSADATTEQQPGTEQAPGSTVQPTESVPPAGGDTAGNGPGETAGQEAQPIQPSPTDVTGQLAGLLDQDGNVVPLKDMPEEQLRKLAQDMDIEGHATLTLEQLVQLIEAETVVVSRSAYTVNRDRLDHNGESYTFGEPIDFADPAQAEALLKLGAILEGE
ncbi:hypothetical protein N5E30_05970 [Pseudomonas chengduensis]|nr:hypothetical protein [Pseudomonas chengduensis]MDH1681129.1 hypothetical protein [Pseudomonas chengduensis]